ncbi:hypothetical protein [Sphingomonas oleivorans]|uniref:hypothetical protein n=1 Tax=Sphingomonas oleivorans TaxID=1735121 RepID=UPI001A9D64D9|nr:hypothetical protein [Sphingomonas oleivorans]
MGAAFYVMVILGCSDAGTACRDVRTLATRYASLDACKIATSAMLLDHSDIDYPVVMAECRPASERLTRAAPRGSAAVSRLSSVARPQPAVPPG